MTNTANIETAANPDTVNSRKQEMDYLRFDLLKQVLASSKNNSHPVDIIRAFRQYWSEITPDNATYPV